MKEQDLRKCDNHGKQAGQAQRRASESAY